MRLRRHHNNSGRTGIKNGSTEKDIRNLSKRLNVPFAGPLGHRRGSEPAIVKSYLLKAKSLNSGCAKVVTEKIVHATCLDEAAEKFRQYLLSKNHMEIEVCNNTIE